MAAGPVSGYCGFDPTGPSLHVGSLTPIMTLVHLQRAGHRPVALIGGGTALIGDPSGKASERPLVAPEVVRAHADSVARQVSRFLDFSGPHAARVRDNAEWLLRLDAVGFLRDVGKHFSVNYMMAKDSVKARLEGGISFTEFSYMLLQAYDFLELYRRDGVTLQLGGSDQWGNITAGIELVRRAAGAEVHGLTVPLLTTFSGAKFGKTEAGAIWLDPNLTSPYRFYQFWVNTSDADVPRYLRRFTLLSREEIEALEAEVATHPEHRLAQRRLAADVTARVHGEKAADIAAQASKVLFSRGDPKALSKDALNMLAKEIPSKDIGVQETYDVLSLLVQAGLALSGSAAKRLLEQGAISVNGQKLGPEERTLSAESRIAGEFFLLKKGSHDFGLIRSGSV
jgi:tyrosyl-tRNA synthetase